MIVLYFKDMFVVSIGSDLYWNFRSKFTTIRNGHLAVTTLRPTMKFSTLSLLGNEGV